MRSWFPDIFEGQLKIENNPYAPEQTRFIFFDDTPIDGT